MGLAKTNNFVCTQNYFLYYIFLVSIIYNLILSRIGKKTRLKSNYRNYGYYSMTQTKEGRLSFGIVVIGLAS